MIQDKNIVRNAGISPGKIAGVGCGEIYYVCKNTTAGDRAVFSWLKRRIKPSRLFTDIQSALDKTVECRNDYVIVYPSDSDYDITAALTMSKKCVHLICPAGLGNERGATNAARIHQNTAATDVIAISDASIEVAGFYFKNYQNISTITLAALSYAPNIHNNTFVMNITSTTAEPVIACSGDAGAWGTVAERNWFVSYAGDDATIAVIVDVGASATSARVCYNDFMMGDGNTATIGIKNLATKGSCNYNTFAKAGADGDYGNCIQVSSYGTAIGNRGTVEEDVMVVGGSADETFSDNMNGVNGGLIDDEAN